MTSKPLASSLLLAAVLAALTILGLRTDLPPEPLPADAPADAFSAARARETLRAITQAPHPVGSAEHARVRGTLVESLTALGLDPQVQHTTAVSQFRADYAADVYNVVARIRGESSSGALLLAAHYDSVINSYGASDDGAGVAAILEVVRALQAGPELRNDVIVLLSDAEEIGLLGATAFVQDHPWFADVAVVVNVEARGSYGAVFMFQTIGANGRLIEALCEATPYPVANTVMQEVYERLPNGTDLSVFAGTGVAGMDLAYIRGLSHYHTPLDNFDNQSPASLQHHGSYLLALATAFGGADFGDFDAPEQTYFNFGPLRLLHYSVAWTLPLSLLAAVLVIGLLTFGLARGQVRVIPVLLGLVAAVVSVGVAVLLGRFGWSYLEAHSASAKWDSYRLFYDSAPYLIAFCAATVAVNTVITWLLRRRTTPVELVAAPLVLWAGVGVVSAVHAPGASYLFIWPTLAATLAAVVSVPKGSEPDAKTAVLLGLLAAPAIFLVVPWVGWLEVAMGMSIVAVCVGLLAFVLILLSTQLAIVVRGLGAYVPGTFLIVSLVAAGWALLTPEYNETRKRPNHVAYFADLATPEAHWISFDPEVDEFTEQFLGSESERGSVPALGFGNRTVWHAPTTLLEIEQAAVTVVDDVVTEDSRQVEVRIQPRPGTFRTVVESMPTNPPIRGLLLEGRWPLELRKTTDQPQRLVTYTGSPPEGFTLRLTVPAAQALHLRIRSTRPGLPIVPERARADDTMNRGDTTVVRSIVEIPSETMER